MNNPPVLQERYVTYYWDKWRLRKKVYYVYFKYFEGSMLPVRKIGHSTLKQMEAK